MTDKHTQAPWSITPYRDNTHNTSYHLNDEVQTDEEARANANLMECAPDMLELLQWTYDHFECHSEEETICFELMEETIKKALEGEQ